MSASRGRNRFLSTSSWTDSRRTLRKRPGFASFEWLRKRCRNVARHAHAQAVQVSLHSLNGGLQLAVADNGAGFDPADEPQQPSLGLASMRERVRLLEGKLHVESKRGRGTTIFAWIPVKTHDLPDTANRENGESAFTNGVQVGAISARGES